MRVCRLLSVAVLAVFVTVAAAASDYLGPQAVVASPDGTRLFVADIDARQITVVDLAAAKPTRLAAVADEPTGLAISPDGKTLYVTCAAPDSVVLAMDSTSGKVKASIPAGHTAIGPSVSPDGKRLYVCNRFNNDVSVTDLASGKTVARVPVVREPYATAISPDGKSVYVINHLPLDPSDSYDVAVVVTVIDTTTHQTRSIRLPNGSTGLRGVCVSADGKYVYATHILARYQMPTTQLERGWMNTNALSILDATDKKLINTVLLDDVDLGGANPWGVAATADGKWICVSHAGTHELSVIDAPGLMKKLAAASKETASKESASKESDPKQVTTSAVNAPFAYTYDATAMVSDVPNDLAFLVDLRRRIPLGGNGPRGLAVVGCKAYVAEYFTDTLAVVDLDPENRRPASQIALGPAPKLDKRRLGERYLHDADLCFQHWQSCSSCHPDARVDALNWDLMNDGLGTPKNVRSMLLAHKTPPAMATAVRATAEAAVRSGITHIQFAVRPEKDAMAIDEYLKSLRPVPSPHLVDGKLTPAAKRGKRLFFDEKVGCSQCHPGPMYTDLQSHDVSSRGQYDRTGAFDTPTLIECWRTAPYMHDGRYTTMKELFTKGKHGNANASHGGLTDQQIDDLVEFVLSL